ncbi:hypothetical protein M8494_12995 [Serratia ureilytica]
MTDVHQFFQLLSRNKLTRQQAFRAVGNDLAYRWTTARCRSCSKRRSSSKTRS